jgi:hypothetical protein
VRNITKKISDLNEKLDTTSTLSEPRENSFLRYEYKHNDALREIAKAVGHFGRIAVSTTFPALSTGILMMMMMTMRMMVMLMIRRMMMMRMTMMMRMKMMIMRRRRRIMVVMVMMMMIIMMIMMMIIMIIIMVKTER